MELNGDVRDVITILHGAGGTYMYNLVKNVITKILGNETGEIGLVDLDDSAVISGVAFTTDSYTISPYFSLEEILGDWLSAALLMIWQW